MEFSSETPTTQVEKAPELGSPSGLSAQPQSQLSSAGQLDLIKSLYLEFSETLTGALRRDFGDGPPDPRDTMQLAFQKLIERGDYGNIRNLKSFLWRTARNLALEKRRTAIGRSKFDYEVEQIFFPLKSDTSTPEAIAIAKDQLRLVSDMLSRMPEKRRRAVVLHRIEGLSITEIGLRLGVSRSTASEHLHRGIADLDVAILRAETG